MRQLRRYGSGALLIVVGVAFALVLALAPSAGARAHDGEAEARQDFDRMVQAIGGQYHIHSKSVPMMGLASLCAKVATHGGVGGLKVVEFASDAADEDVADEILHGEHDHAAGSGFAATVRAALGERWTQMVRQHSEDGEESLVYVQNETAQESDLRHTRLVVVELDQELHVVSLSLDAQQLERWMNEEEGRHGWTTAGHAHDQRRLTAKGSTDGA